jgi:hypothetical protein
MLCVAYRNSSLLALDPEPLLNVMDPKQCQNDKYFLSGHMLYEIFPFLRVALRFSLRDDLCRCNAWFSDKIQKWRSLRGTWPPKLSL